MAYAHISTNLSTVKSAYDTEKINWFENQEASFNINWKFEALIEINKVTRKFISFEIDEP